MYETTVVTNSIVENTIYGEEQFSADSKIVAPNLSNIEDDKLQIVQDGIIISYRYK